MYPDPITPRAHPSLLQDPAYDPFGVMPAEFPAHPRVVTTPALVADGRRRLAGGDAPSRRLYDHLRGVCEAAAPAGEKRDAAMCSRLSRLALRQALAALATDDAGLRGRAVENLGGAAGLVNELGLSGFDMDLAWNLAGAFDVLSSGGLPPDCELLTRQALAAIPPAMDRNSHAGCNNQSSFSMLGRMAAAAALGDRAALHDALYGCEREGRWRYGLIHLLRHDFLADGMHWEGVQGYHMLVMLTVAEMLSIMEHLGVDLWKREFRPLMHDDGHDEHRGYGPKSGKGIRAAFDAFFYQAFPNGDYSHLHDQVLGNLLGTHCWWSFFNKAYEVWGDPKYAWLLQRMRAVSPETPESPLPAWFRNGRGDIELFRLRTLDYPAGHFSFADDARIGQLGRHERGCSLFPVHGSAILRAQPERPDSVAAYLYFGPHWAGHRGPAALHLDLHAGGHRVTAAPHIFKAGYSDPRHLTWNRTTIAHNTVTIDETPMFPYDFETESLWECDLWRDGISDGRLELFQPGAGGFQAVRASNDNVYDGVRLDRTVVVTRDSVIDVFRIVADRERVCDWAMHGLGRFEGAPVAGAADLGARRGYRHLENARRLHVAGPSLELALSGRPVPVRVQVVVPAAGSEAFVADDPAPDERGHIADSERPAASQALIVRTRAARVLVVAVWSFGEAGSCRVRSSGQADGDVRVEIEAAAGATAWELPPEGPVRSTTGGGTL